MRNWFAISSFLALAGFGVVAFDPVTGASAGGSLKFLEPYAVEGLAVGASVNRASREYRRYRCNPSDQYDNSIACKLTQKTDGETKIITILHLDNDVVTYINKAVFPASFSIDDINAELSRLSKRFQQAPQIIRSSEGVIAKWGAIDLVPLSKKDLMDLAKNGNPNRGYLIDFRMDFHESARSGLPVYRLEGGKGFIWIARFQTSDGDGTLRFLAADPSQMPHASGGDGGVPPHPTEPVSTPSDNKTRDPACQKYPDLC